MTREIIFWALSALALVGAATVVFTREVMRLVLGLGAFLLGLAGLFALYGYGFLAVAEIFVYVGGVLVLLLFAIMLVHRSTPGEPSVDSRHDPLAAVGAIGLASLIALALRPLAPGLEEARDGGVDALGDVLLGPMLPHFMLAGILLLAALVAVVTVMGGDEE